MASICNFRAIRLRPAICTGKHASGISASMKSGYTSPPDERMHATHGRAEDEPQVIHIKAFRQQLVLSQNHVVVIVLREMRVQAVARLRRFLVTDAVRKNDEVATRVQELPGTEELSRKLRLEELLARAARAVKNQHRIRNAPLRVARWLP